MSDSPCTACRATNNGRLFYAYVNHYVDEDLQKRRVRLCRDCIADVLMPLVDGADWQVGREWETHEQRLARLDQEDSARYANIQPVQLAERRPSDASPIATNSVHESAPASSVPTASGSPQRQPESSSRRSRRAS
jgi:hypothetical protein